MNDGWLLAIASALLAAVCAVLVVYPERAVYFLDW
jgi:hypothetical protein